jgi:hypothetical protein
LAQQLDAHEGALEARELEDEVVAPLVEVGEGGVGLLFAARLLAGEEEGVWAEQAVYDFADVLVFDVEGAGFVEGAWIVRREEVWAVCGGILSSASSRML